MTWVIEKHNGVSYIWSGEDLPLHESAIVVSNHQYTHDWLVVLSLARRKGMLGYVKFFLKQPIKYIPGVGLGFCK